MYFPYFIVGLPLSDDPHVTINGIRVPSSGYSGNPDSFGEALSFLPDPNYHEYWTTASGTNILASAATQVDELLESTVGLPTPFFFPDEPDSVYLAVNQVGSAGLLMESLDMTFTVGTPQYHELFDNLDPHQVQGFTSDELCNLIYQRTGVDILLATRGGSRVRAVEVCGGQQVNLIVNLAPSVNWIGGVKSLKQWNLNEDPSQLPIALASLRKIVQG